MAFNCEGRLEWNEFTLIFCLHLVSTHGNDNVMSRIFSLRFPFSQAISLNMENGKCLLKQIQKAYDLGINPPKVRELESFILLDFQLDH